MMKLREQFRPSTPPASSTPRARPSATTGTRSTGPIARRCPSRWCSRSRRSTRPCACSAGRCSSAGHQKDDAIGTLARTPRRAVTRVVISTGDKDLAQLVDANVTLINTMTNERLDIAGVNESSACRQRIVDYLTLVGDSVDNVPGVEGRPEDGREVARRARFAGRGDRRRRRDEGRRRREPAQGAALAAAGWRPVTVVTDCDLTGHVPGWPGLWRACTSRRWTATGCSRSSSGTTVCGPSAKLLGADAPPRKQRHRSRCGGQRPAAGRSAAALRHRARLGRARRLDRQDHGRAADRARHRDRSLDPMRAQLVGISLSVAPGGGLRRLATPARRTTAGRRGAGAPAALASRTRPGPSSARTSKYDTHVFANAGIDVRGYALRHPCSEEAYVPRRTKLTRPGKPNSATRSQRAIVEDLYGKGAWIVFAVDISAPLSQRRQRDVPARAPPPVAWNRRPSRTRFVYEQIEMPVSRVLAHRTARRAHRQRVARHAEPRACRAHARPRSRPRAGRAAVQSWAHPSRSARSCSRKLRAPGRPQDGEGAVDRRGGTGEARRRLPAAGQVARAPRPVETEGHLPPVAAADGQPGDRPRAYQLRGGGSDRAGCRATNPTCRTSRSGTPEGRRVREDLRRAAGQ